MMERQGIVRIHLELAMPGFLVIVGCLIPKKSHKGNVQLGLGIKLPTGNYITRIIFIKKLIQVYWDPLISQYSR
jgi:hypothetical protein